MKNRAGLYRSLASMHHAGIGWAQALESAAGGDASLAPVQRRLDRGATLGEAFQGVADPLDAALIEAGEKDGSLERVLADMAQAHEDASRRRKQEWASLTYPILLAHIGAVLLPFPDLWQGNHGAALLWAAAVLVPTWAFLGWRISRARRERPRPRPGTSPPEPPAALVGPWRTRVEEADARGLDALGRLLDAGVPLDQTLELAIQAGWGGRVAVDLDEARRRARRGDDIAGAWSHLPLELSARLRTGEEAGSLGQAACGVADGLRFDADIRRKRAAAILPVAFYLVIAAIIAWRILSFYGAAYGRLGR